MLYKTCDGMKRCVIWMRCCYKVLYAKVIAAAQEATKLPGASTMVGWCTDITPPSLTPSVSSLLSPSMSCYAPLKQSRANALNERMND